MYKKVLAILLAGAMVLPTALPVMAAGSEAAAAESEAVEAEADDSVTAIGDDADVKEALESGLADRVQDEEGTFDPDKRTELMGTLFGPDEVKENPDYEHGTEEEDAFFNALNAAIDQHLVEEMAESLEAGDETVISRTIADLDFLEDGTIRLLGYFSVTNFDKDKDCPEDLLVKNFAGQPELMSVAGKDGAFAVADFVTAEDGEDYADSVRAMCRDTDLDPADFYETLALSDVNYLTDLYLFMEAHPEYDHIEYMGEMLTMEELVSALDDEFDTYLELYALGAELSDEAEPEAEQVDFRTLADAFLLEAAFPSWNPDSEALQELTAFVADCTDEMGEGYLAPEDRVAVFDMDGTILCEKAPVYIDWCLTMHRVLDDPDFSATEEERAAMEEIREHAYTDGETYVPEGDINKETLVASAFAGMTPEEFRSYVADFADQTPVVGFEGMTYGSSFYLPMLEVIEYLKDNDFDVWIVSGCEREVVRALVERFAIPFDHVIATDVPYIASGKAEDEAGDKYNMSKDEEILLGTPRDPVECIMSSKPAAIAREIGKDPVLAFGNSTGDYSMLNYTESNPDHEGKGFFVVCDDTEREYGSDEKAAGFYEEAEKQGWTAISMANDWATIYGEDVQKTQLPGSAEAAETEEAAEAA